MEGPRTIHRLSLCHAWPRRVVAVALAAGRFSTRRNARGRRQPGAGRGEPEAGGEGLVGSSRARSARMVGGPAALRTTVTPRQAGVAQLVEQLIRNQQVTRSSRVAGSKFPRRSCAASADLKTGFLNDADATTLAAAWLRLDDDLHVLPEPGQEAHQAFAREARESAIQQRGHLGLVDPHHASCSNLRELDGSEQSREFGWRAAPSPTPLQARGRRRRRTRCPSWASRESAAF